MRLWIGVTPPSWLDWVLSIYQSGFDWWSTWEALCKVKRKVHQNCRQQQQQQLSSRAEREAWGEIFSPFRFRWVLGSIAFYYTSQSNQSKSDRTSDYRKSMFLVTEEVSKSIVLVSDPQRGRADQAEQAIRIYGSMDWSICPSSRPSRTWRRERGPSPSQLEHGFGKLLAAAGAL